MINWQPKILVLFIVLFSSVLTIRIQPFHQISQVGKDHQKNDFDHINNEGGRLLQSVNLNSQSLNLDGLMINHPLPTTFSNKEIFQIRGSLVGTSGTNGDIYINFIMENNFTNQRFEFLTKVTQGGVQFRMDIDFTRIPEGQYKLAIFRGFTGYSQQRLYRVISQIPSGQVINSSPASPYSFGSSFQNNKIYLTWQSSINQNSVQRVVFRQGFKQKQYYLSNFNGKFEAKFKDFSQFIENENVIVSISTAYSSSLSLSLRNSDFSTQSTIVFNPIKHHFSEFNNTQITFIQQLPWQVVPYQTIVIKGFALVNLQNKIIIQKPSQEFIQYNLNDEIKNDVLPAGSYFYKQISFTENGAYIFQINNEKGGAALNRPFYVGYGTPLLPDFVDLSPQYPDYQNIINKQPIGLDQQRRLLLNLINQKRNQYGVPQISLDNTLNQLAQAYSNDMSSRLFFGHWNPEGQGPQQRAQRFGIKVSLGQNVAQNIDIVDAHNRLCRSPVHLKNIVGKSWTRVGLGLTRNFNNEFLIAQQFGSADYSITPLTQSENSNIRDSLVSFMIQNYPPLQYQNTGFSSVLSQWQSLSIQQQNSQDLVNFIVQRGFGGFTIDVFTITYTPQNLQYQKNAGFFTPSKKDSSQFGLAIKFNGNQLQILIGYL